MTNKVIKEPYSKNRELLDSFIHYCENAPDQRFWQALVNWWKSYMPDVNFILWADSLDIVSNKFDNIVDSYYFEDKFERDDKDKYY